MNNEPTGLPSDLFPKNMAGTIMQADQAEDTASCMSSTNCHVDDPSRRLKWEAIYPQGHLSMSQGFVGQRKASFQGSQNELRSALSLIYNSHWPWPDPNDECGWSADCLPIDIQFGPSFDKANVLGNIADAEISQKLESFNEYTIHVIYQLLHLTDTWPLTGKPDHPNGSTLTLQVRGGGELLLIDPNGISSGSGNQISGCFNGTEPWAGQYNPVQARMVIPLTEYHLTCDRLDDAQLCLIMHKIMWKCREQTTNCDVFLGEAEGTLLFDSWTLDQTFVPDISDPRRWRLGCVLKCRQVPGMRGPYPDDCVADCAGSAICYPIGWNHDYKRGYNTTTHTVSIDLGWHFIMMNVGRNWNPGAAATPFGSCTEPYVPRFKYVPFKDLFWTTDEQPCNNDAICHFDCDGTSADPGCDMGAKPGVIESSMHEAGYEDIEEQIARIVDDSRHAAAHKTMLDHEMRSSGTIERWPANTPKPLRELMLDEDVKRQELIERVRYEANRK